MTRLQEHYDDVVRPALMKEFSYTNPMQVPRLDKIVINMGVGEARAGQQEGRGRGRRPDRDHRPEAGDHQGASKSIATFKLREGMPIGCKVTLRRERMYEFLDRLINIALPRVRDFRGVSGKSFDGRGNYALGLKEQIVLPGDRLRQDRCSARHGHRHLHDGEDRRRGQGAAEGLRHAVRQLSGLEERSMAKKSSIERNQKRERLAKQFAGRRRAR